MWSWIGNTITPPVFKVYYNCRGCGKENGIGQEYKKNIVGSAWECNDHL